MAGLTTSYYWLKLASTQLAFYSVARNRNGKKKITGIKIVCFASSYLTKKARLENSNEL